MRDDERCGRSKEVNRPELIGQRVRVRVRTRRLEFHVCTINKSTHTTNVWKLI